MTTRANPMAGRYFNDPNFAAAISNLAGAFAPPSPDEYLMAEKVKGERMTNDVRNRMLGLAGDNFDKLGIVGDLYDPTQSYYSVDQSNATDRRGQDVAASTALDKARIDGAYGLAGTKLGYGDAMPGLTPEMAAAIGMPAMGPVTGAGLGAPAPLMSETEMMAKILGEQDAATQRAIVGSSIDPVEVMGADGPVYSDPLASLGQPAYVDKGSQASTEIFNYLTPDGREGTALFDPNTSALVDASSKQPLPQGTQTYKLAGGDKALLQGATTSNVTDANKVIATAQYGLDRLGQFRTLLEQNPGVLGIPGTIRGFGQDVVAGAMEMGAAFGDTEGVMDSVDEVRQLAERVTGSGNYDPAIAQAYSYALEMAYLQAKMQDPGGEVNVKELERILGTFDGGIAGNSQVLANLDILQGQLNDRIKYGENLKAGAEATPVPVPDAGTGGGTRLRFDENGNQIQ